MQTSSIGSPTVLSPQMSPETGVRNVLELNDVQSRYQSIVSDPKYQHFVRIPERIIRSLEYFGVEFDREAVRERLRAYYLFIGVVDEAIDSGQARVAEQIFECFNDATVSLHKGPGDSDIRIVTEMMSSRIDDDIYALFLQKLRESYLEVVRERAATSIEAYIKHRKAIGSRTAEQSYLLIRSSLNEDNRDICRFMQQVGAVGCLIDSVIDLRSDHRRGLLNFKPTLITLARLALSALSEGLRVWARHPQLTLLFLEAVTDNVRDRERTAPDSYAATAHLALE